MVKDEEIQRIIFRRAKNLWHEICEPRVKDNSKVTQYVLIEQYDVVNKGLGFDKGKAKRAWIQDDSGLREVSGEEYRNYRRKRHRPFWRYVQLRFFVYPDKFHIMIEEQFGSRAASGGSYLVQSTNKGLTLEPDPEGSFWIS